MSPVVLTTFIVHR